MSTVMLDTIEIPKKDVRSALKVSIVTISQVKMFTSEYKLYNKNIIAYNSTLDILFHTGNIESKFVLKSTLKL